MRYGTKISPHRPTGIRLDLLVFQTESELISRTQIEKFVKEYISTIDNQSAMVPRNYKILVFPSYLSTPHKIKCTISSTFGTAIHFDETSEKWNIEVSFNASRIADAVLPKISDSGVPLMLFGGQDNGIIGINFITKEFFDRYERIITGLSRGVNFRLDGNFSKFFDITAGDLRLLDVSLAYLDHGKDVVSRIPCLWLFASNSSLDFTPEKAKALAILHYRRIVDAASQAAPVQGLIGTLDAYQKLLEKQNLVEQDLQTFLDNNPILMEPAMTRKWTKGDLRRFRLPEADFMLKTSDNRFLIVELESPADRLLVPSTLGPSAELRAAETQISNYLNDIQNNILTYRNSFDRDLSVEKVSAQIIIGRSSKLSDDQKKAFDKHVSTLKYSVVTYDEVFQRNKTFLDNLGLRYGGFVQR